MLTTLELNVIRKAARAQRDTMQKPTMTREQERAYMLEEKRARGIHALMTGKPGWYRD